MAVPLPKQSLNELTRERLHALREQVEQVLDADVLSSYGPLMAGTDSATEKALAPLSPRRDRLAVLLYTGGGVVTVVERMVDVMRHYYKEVWFVIVDQAYSAGAVLAMSGDAIFMNHYSRLGPIDPQIVRDGKLVPALSYLEQFERLLELGRSGKLSEAEFALLQKFDLAELHQFEQARELTITLLKKWLVKYKFKGWDHTETRGLPVDNAMKVARAAEIATELNNHTRWHSHGRGISAQTLRDELNLRVDDFTSIPGVAEAVDAYHTLLVDYLLTVVKFEFGFAHIHTRTYL